VRLTRQPHPREISQDYPRRGTQHFWGAAYGLVARTVGVPPRRGPLSKCEGHAGDASAGPGPQVTAIDSRRYFATLRRWWWLPFAGMLLAAAISYAVIKQLPHMYEGRATLLVDFTSFPAGPNYNDALLSQQLVKTYAQMAVQPVILEQIGPRLGVDMTAEQLAPRVSAQPVRDTQLFVITARASEPDLARNIANTIAETFIAEQDRRLADNHASGATSVIQPARLPLDSVEPKTSAYVSVSAGGAFLLMLGLVYLLAWFDDTVKGASDAERAAGLPTLGVIPEERRGSNRAPAPAIEAYRLLRTAVDFACARRPVRTLLMTSAGRGEGKTTITANLGAAMARAGVRVILVDADLRSPALHKRFGLANDRGLSMLLEDVAEREEALDVHIRTTATPNLRVLTAGPLPAAPTELLQLDDFRLLLNQLRQQADVIMVDSPPALAVADALVVARQADAALLVVAAHSTRVAAVRRLRARVAQSGTRLLGTVVNRAHGGWERYEPSAPPVGGDMDQAELRDTG
jgi:polysaccharide biosynthesis transport protein